MQDTIMRSDLSKWQNKIVPMNMLVYVVVEIIVDCVLGQYEEILFILFILECYTRISKSKFTLELFATITKNNLKLSFIFLASAVGYSK